MPAIDKTFDYLVPDALAGQVQVGTIVRIELHGRRVRGWVTALGGQPGTDRPLRPLAMVTGRGPAPDLLELSSWAAWRWAGPRASFLRTASPPVAIRALPPATPGARASARRDDDELAADAFARRRSVVRLPPAADPFPLVLAATRRGPALVLAPSLAAAGELVRRLRAEGVAVASVPRDWARAAAGGCAVVGARATAWAPVPGLAAVVLMDEHDESWQEERTPTWHARDVAAERAARAGAPCVLTSPCPSLEALAWGEVVVPSRAAERRGWPVVEVADRRRDDPRLGLYSARLVSLLRSGRRVAAVLNRKGRARLLACAACGELARCERCGGRVEEAEGAQLRCPACGATRPSVCAACGASRLKVVRAGVTRVREELERLAGEPVSEVSGDAPDGPSTRVAVGTEAVLHRTGAFDAVAFLDFDQELLAPRYRAPEQALALLARAARLVGGRERGGVLLVQTRLPDHEVLDAAVHADPSRLSVVEGARRAALRLPPEAAMALVSGPAAQAFVDSVPGTVERLGPSDGRWLLRAPDHRALCDALAATPRPAGRLRVEVDPLRV